MTIAQLPACRYIYNESRLSLEREKIRLSMGVLKVTGDVWGTGQMEYRVTETIAREILSLQDEDIEIHETAPVVPLDALDFNFDFGVDWRCDSFANLDGLQYTGNMVEI
jgi:hypothetical protein